MRAPSTRSWAMALWRCLGRPWRMRTTPCAPVMPPWPCRRPCDAMPRRCAAPTAWRCRSVSGSTPGKSWCAPSATTYTWTTRPLARPRIWRPAWNSSPRRGAFASQPRRCGWSRDWCKSPPLGPVPVKGLAEPVEVFELIGVSALRRRLQVGGRAWAVALCGAAAGAGGAAAGPGTGRNRPGAGRRTHRGARGGQIASGLRVPALPPHAGLAAAGE